MDREQWLAERMLGVGGSDAAAALGLSQYKTPFALWLEKTENLAPEDIDDCERIQFGRLMEDVIAQEYARRMGVKLRRRNQVLKHAKYPWMIANVDRVVEGERRGVECKNVDAMVFRMGDWGEPGSDEVPEEYLLQCHHYMTVLDYPEWHLAACVGGNHYELFIIRRDPELEKMIIDGEHEFWQRVETRTAPEPDHQHPSTVRLLQRLYPGSDGSTIELDSDIEHWHQVKQQADHLAKQYGEVSDAARNHILTALGSATFGRLSDGSGYRRKVINRKAYEVEAKSFIDCRHVKAKD